MFERAGLAAQFMCALLQNPAIIAGEKQITDIDYLEKLGRKAGEIAEAFAVSTDEYVWEGDPEAEGDEDDESEAEDETAKPDKPDKGDSKKIGKEVDKQADKNAASSVSE